MGKIRPAINWFLCAQLLCVKYEKSGIVRVARVLDHIVPASKAHEIFWDTDNWQGLNRRCHVAVSCQIMAFPQNRANQTIWMGDSMGNRE